MLQFRVLNGSHSPTASLARHHAPKLNARNQKGTFASQRKTSPISFQSFTHSSQFTNRSISRIFFPLRTLRQNTPGVGSLDTPQKIAVPLTPIESISFDSALCKPFRILLFKNAPLQPLWNLTLSQRGWGGGGSRLPVSSRHGPQRRGRFWWHRFQPVRVWHLSKIATAERAPYTEVSCFLSPSKSAT
jgi:hypothetical protein